ncbi:MAG: SH3 domain-containing protein [Butyrivibrio sp.]|nr:SH3 domain-containing protein [Butyrivibrio sp.]
MIKKIYNKNNNLIMKTTVLCAAVTVGLIGYAVIKQNTVPNVEDYCQTVPEEEDYSNCLLLSRTDTDIAAEEVTAQQLTDTLHSLSVELGDTLTDTPDYIEGLNVSSGSFSMEQQLTANNLPQYTVTVYDTAVTMYTNDRVNVRNGAGTEYARLATLSWSTAVSVTGVTDNGWYQIDYNGSASFVSADYVQETAPAVPYVFVGDSRTVQMQAAVGTGNNVWISKVGQGYSWFKNQIDLIDDYASAGSKVIINMGVNDICNVSKYANLINSYMDSWTEQGITVYYAAVTPVYDGISVSNDQIESFNSTLQSKLDSRITWIDGYSYLSSTGFTSADGLHYNNATYRSLYSYYMSQTEDK